MPAVKGKIRSLINGISQQAPLLRRPSQGEVQENYYSSVVRGLTKRPPTEYVAKLKNTYDGNEFVHFMDESSNLSDLITIIESDETVTDVFDETVSELDPWVPAPTQYWKFEETSGTSAANEQPGGTVGTYVNTPTLNQTGIVPSDTAPIAVDLDGTNEEITCGTVGQALTYPFAITMVVRPLAAGQQELFSTNDSANYAGVSAWVDATTGFVNIQYGDNTGAADTDRLVQRTGDTGIRSGSNHLITIRFYGFDDATVTVDGQSFDPLVTVIGTGTTTSFAAGTFTWGRANGGFGNIRLDRGIVHNSNITEGMSEAMYLSYLGRKNRVQVYDFDGNRKTLHTSTLGGGSFPSATGLHMDYFDSTDPINDYKAITIADTTFVINTKTQIEDEVLANGTVQGTLQEFTDLVNITPALGDIYEIRGDVGVFSESYYVERTPSSPSDFWSEGTNSRTQADRTLAPFKLQPEFRNISNGDDLSLEPGGFRPREAGNFLTNPHPVWVQETGLDQDITMTDMFFFKNRLGTLASDIVSLSEDGNALNFLRTTVTTTLDTDPLEVSAQNKCLYAVPFDKSLVVFTSKSQLLLTSSGALTPTTLSVTPTTSVSASPLVRAISAGQNVYFVGESGQFSNLNEFFVDSETFTNDVIDISSHIPEYIPKNIRLMEPVLDSDLIALVSSDERNVIYVYKYFWVGNERRQSSWSKWILDEDDEILAMNAINSKLYLIVGKTGHGVFLYVMDLEEGITDAVSDHRVLLDTKVEVEGNYDSANDVTNFLLPSVELSTGGKISNGAFPVGSTVTVVIGNDSADHAGAVYTATVEEAGFVLPGPFVDTNVGVKIPGDVTTVGGLATAYIGIPYTAMYEMSPQYITDPNDERYVDEGRLQLTYIQFSLVDTGYVKVQVTPCGRDPYTYEFTGKTIGDKGFTLGDDPVQKQAVFRIPISSEARSVKIEIINDTNLPSSVLSAEWDGIYIPKTGGR